MGVKLQYHVLPIRSGKYESSDGNFRKMSNVKQKQNKKTHHW